MNDHDKDMLAIDGEIFAKCFRLLGLDETGTDIQIIPVSIAALRAERDSLSAELERMRLISEVLRNGTATR